MENCAPLISFNFALLSRSNSYEKKVIPTYLYGKSVFGYFRSIFSSGKLVTRWFGDRHQRCCQRGKLGFIRELINGDKSENESGKYSSGDPLPILKPKSYQHRNMKCYFLPKLWTCLKTFSFLKNRK